MIAFLRSINENVWKAIRKGWVGPLGDEDDWNDSQSLWAS
jgi:hypothetical protein